MAFIPKEATWYIAQVVLEIAVEQAIQNVVHVNYHLVRADSPETAYEKARTLGQEHESSYLNQEDKRVTITFRGLRNLTVLYEPLEDGAEILYEEYVGLKGDVLSSFIVSKESLGVFKPIQRSRGPDYGSAEIRRAAKQITGAGN